MSKKNIVGYIDAFVLVVPKNQVAKYKKMAKGAADIWLKYGALGYKECVGDDLSPDMQGYSYMPFDKLAKVKPDETVWFSYIEYQNKRQRDQVNKKVMKEMEAGQQKNPDHMKDMPFDMKRFSYGGFKVEVSD